MATLAPPLLVLVLDAWLDRDDVPYWSKAADRAVVEAACEAGTKSLCGWLDKDEKQRVAAVEAGCMAGEPAACVGAALGMAWASSGAAPADGKVYEARLRLACDAEVAGSCALLAMAAVEGVAGPPNYRQGVRELVELCADGDGLACFLVGDAHGEIRAVELGLSARHPAGVVSRRAAVLSARDTRAGVSGPDAQRELQDKALRVWRPACDRGVATACEALLLADLVPAPADAITLFERLVAAGREAAETGLEIARFRAGVQTRQAALDRLTELCSDDPLGCVVRDLMQGGVDVPMAGPLWPLDLNTERAKAAAKLPAVGACLDQARLRGEALYGHVDVYMVWTIEGVSPIASSAGAGGSDAFHQCLSGAFREFALLDVESAKLVHGWFLVRDTVAVDLVLQPGQRSSARDLVKARERMDEIEAQLEPCYDDHAFGLVPALLRWSALSGLSGEFSALRLAQTSGLPELDACVRDVLKEAVLADPLDGVKRLWVEVERRPEVTPTNLDTWWWADFDVALPEPLVIDILSLRFAETRTGEQVGRLSRESHRSIDGAEEDFSAWMATQLDGRVAIRFRRLDIEEPLRDVVLGDEVGMDRYWIAPSDLPPSLEQVVAAHDVDVVMAYVPTAPGAERRVHGVTWASGFADASFVAVPVPNESELMSNRGMTDWQVLLHEWWHTFEFRARALDDWLPDNHRAMRLRGKDLDPVGRKNEQDELTLLAWYRDVMAYLVPGELWAEALQTWTPRKVIRDFRTANYFAMDEIRSDGGYGRAAATPVVLAVAREQRTLVVPPMVQAVVAHVGLSDAPGPDAWSLELSASDQVVYQAEAERGDDGVVRFAVPAVAFDRLVLQPAGDAAGGWVREIEFEELATGA